MAKLTKEQTAQIVARELKGYRVTTSSPAAADAFKGLRYSPEASTPDLATLRKKYLKQSAPELDELPNGRQSSASDDDVIVTVEPEHPADPFSRAARPKTKIISGSKKTIIGSQG
ncbi:MAG TPA: hypothetical protein VF432_04460 [Thermoanaerobaculia bacterium]